MRKQYQALDLFKFLCAILIILLHTSPLGSYSTLLSFGIRHVLTTVAVPCFFIISGFLFFEKFNTLSSKEEQNQYAKKYLWRLITLYLIWSAIYFVFVLIRWYRKGFSAALVLTYIKDFFLEGSYSTIWFLLALIGAMALVFILQKKLRYTTIFGISLAVYIVTLLGTSYYGIASKIPFLKAVFDVYYSVFDTMKNALLFGFVFVALGAVLSEKKDTIVLSQKKTAVLIVVSWLLLAAEQGLRMVIGSSKSSDTVIMLLPLSFFLCLFCIRTELKDRPVYAKLRKYSMCMFLCQRIPMSIVDFWFSDSLAATNSLLYFAVVMGATLAISFVIIEGSKKAKFLNYIY